MATLSPGPRGRPTPHPAANSRRGPGAAHLLARRKRAAGGGRVPSPGCLVAGERPAAKPGGAPGRARAAGTLGRSPPAPAPNPPQGEQQHRGSWVHSDRQAAQLRLRAARTVLSAPLAQAQLSWSAR